MHIGVTQPRARAILGRLLTSALHAVDPAIALQRHVRRKGHGLHVGGTHYDLRRFGRVVAVGAGKASGRMARALEAVLGNTLSDGLVVVKYGHGAETQRIRLYEAGHPVPDEAGLDATRQVLTLIGGLTRDDVVIVLLSGGASSLLPAPGSGLTLSDKQQTTQLLLRSGATIREINTIRKHLSFLKGGRLVAATPARIITLILSDVIGDDLGAIASGLTSPDPTTYEEACDLLRRYQIWKAVSSRVRAYLLAGCRGERPESPKPGAALFRRVQNHIIGNNTAAVEAVAREAKRSGVQPLVLSTSLTGEAREVAKTFGAMAREMASTGRPHTRPACLIAGGECTVSVRGQGTGGRAQEFALAAAPEIAGLRNIWIAAFGTDGTDGPNDAAGAVTDGQTTMRAARLGLDPVKVLLDNDAYPFFKKLNGHITTGPTGTNVNDLYLLLAL